MFKSISKLFESRYTPYQYVKNDIEIEKVSITINVPNPNYEKEQWERGGDNVSTHINVPTGKYITYRTKYELWVKYHKKNGLPKYKKIYKN